MFECSGQSELNAPLKLLCAVIETIPHAPELVPWTTDLPFRYAKPFIYIMEWVSSSLTSMGIMMNVTTKSAIAKCRIIKLILDFRCRERKSEMNTVRFPTAAIKNKALYTSTTVKAFWLKRSSSGMLVFSSRVTFSMMFGMLLFQVVEDS